jgi:hypothetical protein
VDRLAQLRKRNAELTSKFTEESSLVRASEREIESLEAKRRALVMKFPSLITKTVKGDAATPVIDLDVERAQLAQIEGKISILEAYLAEMEQKEKKLPNLLGKINDLERQRESEEEKYRLFKGSMESARIDNSINSSMMPNISIVQEASPPQRSPSALLKKIAFLLAMSGFALGGTVALAFEFLLDGKIKSPEGVERRLGIPLMMSIPFLGKKGGNLNESNEAAVGLALHPYADAICDRLLWAAREGKDKGRPLAVGCTGVGEGAGASTLAEGLAKAFVRNGERVLLVDLASAWACQTQLASCGRTEEPACEVRGKRLDGIGDAAWETIAEGPEILGIARLRGVVEELRSGDYDWILFDLPPVGFTSPTVLLTACLDQVLLVTDPTTARPELLKQDYEEISERTGNLYCIYNKKGIRIPMRDLVKNRFRNKHSSFWLGQSLDGSIPA